MLNLLTFEVVVTNRFWHRDHKTTLELTNFDDPDA